MHQKQWINKRIKYCQRAEKLIYSNIYQVKEENKSD